MSGTKKSGAGISAFGFFVHEYDRILAILYVQLPPPPPLQNKQTNKKQKESEKEVREPSH